MNPGAAILAATLLLAGVPASARDVVLVNGRIFTGDGLEARVGAIAIRGEHIVVVGSADAARCALPKAPVIDLGGRLVIPGLNDAHMHHTPELPGVRVDLPPTATTAVLIKAVADAAVRAPAGAWITGAMPVETLAEAGVDRAALDRAAPDHPVLLRGFTNHLTVANSAALRLLGLDRGKDPLGGRHETNAAGRFSGRFVEYAQWRPERRAAALVEDAAGAASIAALAREAASYGVTTLQNMTWMPAARYAALAARADTGLRFRIIRFPGTTADGLDDDARAVPRRFDPRGRVTVSGTKWILDGTPVERGAALTVPYADRPATRGTLNFAAASVDAMLAKAARDADSIIVHAIGDRATELLLARMEAAPADAGWRKLHPRLEHGEGLTPDLVRRAAALGLTVVVNPSHYYFAELYAARYGEAGHAMNPLASLKRADIPLAIGSDGPLNPFIGLMLAAGNGVRPNEALSLAEALIAYTRGSAAAEGAAADKGSLAPGKLADLAVLDRDIFAVPLESLPATRSLLTLVGGDAIHDSRQLHPIAPAMLKEPTCAS